VTAGDWAFLANLGLAAITLVLTLFTFYRLLSRLERMAPPTPPPANGNGNGAGLPVRSVVEMFAYHDQRLRVLEAELRAAYGHVDAIYTTLETFTEGRGWVAGFKERDPRRRPPAKE